MFKVGDIIKSIDKKDKDMFEDYLYKAGIDLWFIEESRSVFVKLQYICLENI